MGKSKKKSRASKARLNPLSNQKSNENKKDASLVTKKIQPLIKQLQSAIPNDRSMALSSISVLCDDPHMRQLLLKEKLIQIILTHLLNDNNLDIVIESFGLLRNLTLEEGYDIAIHLWRSDIWTSIRDGFEKIKTSLKTINDEPIKTQKHSKRLLFEFADNLISLLVALTNGSDDILDNILQEQNLTIVLELLKDFSEYGLGNLTVALQNTILDVFYDFSSESLDFIDAVMACPPLVKLITELPSTSSNELTQVLIQGIRLQFMDGVNDEEVTAEKCEEVLKCVMDAVNHVNIEEMTKDMSNIVEGEIDTSTLKDQAKKRQSAMMQLQAIEVGIDVVTGIFEIIASADIKFNNSLQVTLTSAAPNFLTTLLEKFPDRVLIAWNNLLWLFVSIKHDVDPQSLANIWNSVTNLEDKNELSIKTGKMSVVWVILKVCGVQGESSLLEQLQVWNNIQFTNSLIAEFKKTEDTGFRQKCCGVLSTIACYQGQNLDINRAIGQFFLECLSSPELDPSLLVDIMTFVFEIYSDEDFDYDKPVFVEGGFLDLLKTNISPNLKKSFKMVDKNKDPELKSQCTNVFNTLDSFIHYKSK